MVKASVPSPSQVSYRHGGNSKRRAYSWRGEEPPYDPSKDKRKDTTSLSNPSHLKTILILELRAVISYAAGASALRLIIQILIQLASYSYPTTTTSPTTATTSSIESESIIFFSEIFTKYPWMNMIIMMPSVISRCLLWFMPRKVLSNDAPGFIYASAWYGTQIKNVIDLKEFRPIQLFYSLLIFKFY